MNRSPLRPALFGGAAWFLLLIGWGLALPNLGFTELLALLGPLVVLPIGFSLMEEFRSVSFMRAAIQLQPAAAFLAALAYLLAPSDLAAALAVPWCLVTFFAATAGLVRLKRSLREGFPALLKTAALFFLPVGGFMMVVNRLGIGLLGFTEPLILLTVVHFHFTGFATPLLAALAGRNAGNGFRRKLLLAAGTALVVAPPLLAAGFVFSPVLQVSAAFALVVGVWGLAALQFTILGRLRNTAARDLLTLSTAAIVAGMALAGTYALGEYLNTDWIDIPTMAWSHGILNGFGFVLCGLAAWRVEMNA